MTTQIDATTRFAYVLTLNGRYTYERETLTTENVTGPVAYLTAGLRPWLLAHLRTASRDNGWYTGYLVTLDEDGSYDTYFSVAAEDVIWYWDEECAPLSSLVSPAGQDW